MNVIFKWRVKLKLPVRLSVLQQAERAAPSEADGKNSHCCRAAAVLDGNNLQLADTDGDFSSFLTGCFGVFSKSKDQKRRGPWKHRVVFPAANSETFTVNLLKPCRGSTRPNTGRRWALCDGQWNEAWLVRSNSPESVCHAPNNKNKPTFTGCLSCCCRAKKKKRGGKCDVLNI